MKVLNIFTCNFIITIIGIYFSFGQDDPFQKANELYSKEDYNGAIEIYENLVSSEKKSANIYYNLGNAYYKSGQIAPAILNYEKALKLTPNDKDIIYNLRIANEQTIDRIDKISEFMLKIWFHSFTSVFSSNIWAYLSIITFILCLGIILFFLFGKVLFLKKMAFILAVFLIISSVFSFVAAKIQKGKIENSTEAIIFTPSVTVYSTPSENGTELFLLHEGTKIKIVEKIGTWHRIQIADGNDGWVEENKFRIISIY